MFTRLLPFLALPLVVHAQELRFLAPPRFGAVCQDPIRGKIVMPSDLLYGFEWDGTVLRQTPDAGCPSPAACYVEPSTGRLLAFVEPDPFGTSPQTYSVWQREGMQWSMIPTAAGPAGPRWLPSLVHDEVRGELLVFGGFDSITGLPRNDTWTFDGSSWTQRTPLNSPPARYAASLACDSTRQRLVLFGGVDNVGTRNDTWEWNGTTWTQVTSAVVPPPTAFTPMAFDAARNRTVLVVSASPTAIATAWTFDGAIWSAGAALPWSPGETPMGLVYDAPRAELLVTGVRDAFGTRAELWGWNGSAWSQRSNLGRLSDTVASAVCATPANTVQRIEGGEAAVASRLWEWNGTTWNLLDANGPPGRQNAVMWSQGGATFLFGGADRLTGVVRGDMWRWNGLSWSQLTPGLAVPPPRQGAGIAFDPVQQRAVLFGGMDQNDLPYADAWTFDGVTWTPIASGPPSRGYHAMAWDAAGQRVVVHGGTGAGSFGPVQRVDTWAWNGSFWQQLANPATAPQGSMAFDANRNALLLVQLEPWLPPALFAFNGSGWVPEPATGPAGGPVPGLVYAKAVTGPAGRFTVIDQAWGAVERVPGPAAAVAIGAACTATAPQLFAAALPRIGDATFELDITRGPSGGLVALVGATTGANLPIGGCTLRVNPNEASLLLNVGPTGGARLGLPIPNQAALLGHSFYFQAAALAPTAPAGFTLSAGLRLDLGR